MNHATREMKIVVAVRCRNEEKHIERFLRCYDFADVIVVSDGGSTDRSIELLQQSPKVKLYHFHEEEIRHDQTWNPDAPHINFVLDRAKEEDPDWLIFDDMDDVPNYLLQRDARLLLQACGNPQVNAYRLYMWGDYQYFPHMNRHFHPAYPSLWAWRPYLLDIKADVEVRHGTIIGISEFPYKISIPYCLMHRSWHPDTIEAKIDRYNKLGLPMNHPLDFAGDPAPLPEWARDIE